MSIVKCSDLQTRVTSSDQLKILGVHLTLLTLKLTLTLSSSGSRGLITEEPSRGETSVSPNDLGGPSRPLRISKFLPLTNLQTVSRESTIRLPPVTTLLLFPFHLSRRLDGIENLR
jgi:hypothetical protein